MRLCPRQKRALNALLSAPQMRENLDSIAGCSNAPELVAGLRRKGVSIPCDRIERYDKDGKACYPGIYSLTAEDKLVVRDWLKGA